MSTFLRGGLASCARQCADVSEKAFASRCGLDSARGGDPIPCSCSDLDSLIDALHECMDDEGCHEEDKGMLGHGSHVSLVRRQLISVHISRIRNGGPPG